MNEHQFCVLRRAYSSLVLHQEKRWEDNVPEGSVAQLLTQSLLVETLEHRLAPTLSEETLIDCTILQYVTSLTSSNNATQTNNRANYEQHGVLQEVLDTLSAQLNFLRKHTKLIDWDDYILIHNDVSKHIESVAHRSTMKEKDLDGFFTLLMERVWGLQHNYHSNWQIHTLQARNTEPICSSSSPILSRQLDVSARKNLMWFEREGSTSESVRLIGYRGVVSAQLDPRILPEYLKSFIFSVEETEQYKHTFLPSQTALLQPYDLIWEKDSCFRDTTKSYMGVEQVILASVELKLLPVQLRQHILTSRMKRELVASDRTIPMLPHLSNKRDSRGSMSTTLKTIAVHYIAMDRDEGTHPSYLRCSQTYGNFTQSASALSTSNAASKKSSHKSLVKGKESSQVEYKHHIWAGRKGSFTRQFASGPYRTSGLNMR